MIAMIAMMVMLVLLGGKSDTISGTSHQTRVQVEPSDCGVSALYALLKVEGRSVKLTVVHQSLADQAEGLVTMRDMRDAATGLGLVLEGRKLTERPSRPTIAHVKLGSGHFLVVRPVGTTEKLVQVLDGQRLPFVIDWENLARSELWSGVGLTPRPGLGDVHQQVPDFW
jgi:ABC-type bacteriocin/lantibiotic exporter with double-glycine peptidase domain